jgi:hypothetical protein
MQAAACTTPGLDTAVGSRFLLLLLGHRRHSLIANYIYIQRRAQIVSCNTETFLELHFIILYVFMIK